MEKQITEYKGLPIFHLTADDFKSQLSGVQTISLVHDDAMEVKKFITLSTEGEQQLFSFSTEDKQLLTGVVIVKEKLIYRRANNNTPERYVTFKEEDILSIVEKYFKDGNNNNINLEHENVFTPATMIESIISKEDNYLGFNNVPAGSWFITMKIHDKQIWQDIKEGKYQGFSLEGWFNEVLGLSKEGTDPTEEFLESLLVIFNSEIPSQEKMIQLEKLKEELIKNHPAAAAFLGV